MSRLCLITHLVNANEKSIQIMNDIFKLRKKTYNLRYLHLFESQNSRNSDLTNYSN